MLLHKRISSIIVLLLLSAVSYSQKGESEEGWNAEEVDSLIQKRYKESKEGAFIREWVNRANYSVDSTERVRLEWIRSYRDVVAPLFERWREKGIIEE